jgi:hypothetical protein
VKKSAVTSSKLSTKLSPPLPESATSRRLRIWSCTVLSLVILGLGLWTAVSTARTVYTTYSPVIYQDQWAIINELQQSNGAVSLGMLWAQHNEHRIPVGRLAVLADMRFFRDRSVSLLIEIYLVQLCLVFLFTWMSRHFGNFKGNQLITISSFFTYCMFSPLQLENFTWGFEITYVFAGLAAAVSFACIIWHAARFEAGKANWISWQLALAFIAAFLAECSLAYGVFVWPVILLLCFSLRLPKRTQLLSGGVGLIAAGMYFVGYYSSGPWAAIRDGLPIGRYFITYFASTWDSTLPSSASWPTVSESMTVLAIAFVLGAALWGLLARPASKNLFQAFLVSNLVLFVIAAALTSLGRTQLGLGGATASRYQSIALLFWASLAALVLTCVPKTRSASFTLLVIQMLLVILMMGAAGRFGAIRHNATLHQVTSDRVYASLAYDKPDLDALKNLYYQAPEMVPVWYAYMRAHNIGPDAREFFKVPPRISKPSPNWGGYRVVAASNCQGFFESARRIDPNAVLAQGWAWDIAENRAPGKMVLAQPGGLLVGFGEFGTPRADVEQTVKSVSSVLTGWSGEALAPKASRLQAFAVLADSTSICPIPNEIQAP